MTAPTPPPEPRPPLDDDQAERLVAYLDGELPEADADAVELALARDAGVRRDVETLRRTWDLLDHLPRPEPSPTFASRTLSRLPIPTATPPLPTPVAARRSRWWQPVAAAAAVFVAFVLGYAATDRLGRGRTSLATRVEGLPVAEAQMLELLPLYRHVDDADFIKGLEQPDLFGEESTWR